MTILSAITNTMRKYVEKIENALSTSTSEVSDKEAVFAYDTEKPEDIVNFSETKSQNVEDKQSVSISSVEQTIDNIPSASYNAKEKIALLEEITGITLDEFRKLSPNKQKKIYDAVQYAITKFEGIYNEGKLNPNADKKELTEEFGRILYEALESGDFKSIDDFEKEIKEVPVELSDDFDSMPADQQLAQMQDYGKRCQQKLQSDLDRAESLPNDKKEKEIQKAKKRHKYSMRARYIEISASTNSTTAANAMTMMPSDDLCYAQQVLLETRCSQKERTATADYMDHDFHKKLIRAKHEMEDDIAAEVVSELVTCCTREKSPEKVEEYQRDYESDREMFEQALKKDPKDLTEEEKELLSYMKAEYYTAIAQGIGSGALENIYMDNTQKAEFIARWEEFAKKYDDYEQVVYSVNEKLNNNPEYKEIKAKVETIRQEKEASQKAENKTNCHKDKRIIKQPVLNQSEFKEQNYPLYITEPSFKQDQKNTTTISKNNISNATKIISKKAIVKKIKEDGLQKTITSIGNDVIETVLDNPNLSYLRPQLVTIIRAYDLESLKALTSSCSDSSFIFVCDSVIENYRDELLENREHTRGLCYSYRKQAERYETSK